MDVWRSGTFPSKRKAVLRGGVPHFFHHFFQNCKIVFLHFYSILLSINYFYFKFQSFSMLHYKVIVHATHVIKLQFITALLVKKAHLEVSIADSFYGPRFLKTSFFSNENIRNSLNI